MVGFAEGCGTNGTKTQSFSVTLDSSKGGLTNGWTVLGQSRCGPVKVCTWYVKVDRSTKNVFLEYVKAKTAKQACQAGGKLLQDPPPCPCLKKGAAPCPITGCPFHRKTCAENCKNGIVKKSLSLGKVLGKCFNKCDMPLMMVMAAYKGG